MLATRESNATIDHYPCVEQSICSAKLIRDFQPLLLTSELKENVDKQSSTPVYQSWRLLHPSSQDAAVPTLEMALIHA